MEKETERPFQFIIPMNSEINPKKKEGENIER